VIPGSAPASKSARQRIGVVAKDCYLIACGLAGARLAGGNLEPHLTAFLGCIAGAGIGFYVLIRVEEVLESRRMSRRQEQ
jgi:hypothetical protein